LVLLAVLGVVAFPVAAVSVAPAPQSKPSASAKPQKPVNPAVPLVADQVVDLVKRDPRAMPSLRQAQLVHLVLQTGDVSSAGKLLEVAKPDSDGMRNVGHISTLLPGGVNGENARAIQAKQRAKPDQLGTIEGIAIGYAYQGKTTQSLAEVRKAEQAGSGQLLLANLMVIRPVQPFIDAYFKTPKVSISKQSGGALLRAYVILGQQDKADALVQEIRASGTSADGVGEVKSRVSMSANEVDSTIFRGQFFGYLAKGDLTKARKLEEDRFAAAMAAAPQAKQPRAAEAQAMQDRLFAFQALAATAAFKRDLPAVRSVIDGVKDKSGVAILQVPLIYALAATGGDAASIDESLKSMKNSFETLHAAALGAAAAGRFAGGDSDDAVRRIQQALAWVATMKSDRQRAAALYYLLAGTIAGPEAVLFTEHYYDSFPLQLLEN
jgi:hypothetical protein